MSKSFIPVSPESHFPIQNLPYGVFSTAEHQGPRVGVAIGEFVLDLAVLEQKGYLKTKHIFNHPNLNSFMALGRSVWHETRSTLQALLSDDTPILRDDPDLQKQVLHPMQTVTMHLPAAIGDYTDFYSSKEHATNIGSMIRSKENPLMPNWVHIPIAYHGRASSVVVSGTDIRRPNGQTIAEGADGPTFGPSRNMDFELEMGFFVGPGNPLGHPIPIENAEEHIFGLVLINDWSARDIQKWEYQPLGPFLSKNLATSISPWVVTLDALEPFRCENPSQSPTPLPYLQNKGAASYDIKLEVSLQTKQMNSPVTIARSNFRYMYWTMRQQLAHHTVNGCNMRPGDLLGSGTISGPTQDSYGSLMELTWRGEHPLNMPSGEKRTYLEDGDALTLTGWCEGEGYRVGFGEVTGKLLPAHN
ncbi:MAG TPA: fumarylacetoacetase [Anaerolineales bacterium]|nr:fumarylacetoacetase [Anaerolineales bacterium]